jgi:hypothetical protein
MGNVCKCFTCLLLMNHISAGLHKFSEIYVVCHLFELSVNGNVECSDP